MEVLKIKTNMFDIEELACKVLGLDYVEIDADTQIIEEKIAEEFFIDLETFQNIIERLLPLIDYGKSELTNKKYKGFSDIENQTWLVKAEVNKFK